MGTASIAQEYYKVQEYWETIEADEEWRLAVWSLQYPDVEIVDKFMEIERSALGKFEDIFFRFETAYRGEDEPFEKELFEEWAGWFEEKPEPGFDILQALKNDEMLLFDYRPDRELKPTAANLWKEMLRFKSSVVDMEETHFCVYLPPTLPEGKPLTDWFSAVLDGGVPQGIRLATLDYAEKRKVKLKPSQTVRVLEPELDTAAAVSSDMNRGIVSDNAISPENQYTLQVKKVMESTPKKDASLLDKEIKKLFSLASQINTVSVSISSLLIAAQACYMINGKEKSGEYADRAMEESAGAMKAGLAEGYPVWKAALMLKAALLAGANRRREAIELYEKLGEEATERSDIFYILEAYRMAGHFYYELGELNTSLETLLLSLYGGSFLDRETRRQSTFLLSAALALHLAKQTKSSDEIGILEHSLEEWLGTDWKKLVETEGTEKVRKRRKSSIFS